MISRLEPGCFAGSGASVFSAEQFDYVNNSLNNKTEKHYHHDMKDLQHHGVHQVDIADEFNAARGLQVIWRQHRTRKRFTKVVYDLLKQSRVGKGDDHGKNEQTYDPARTYARDG